MATPASSVAAEHILCDTSFVSIVQSGAPLPSWPAAVLARLDAAILAISVVALAELRDGHMDAEWGTRRRQRAEQLISSYLLVPLDMAIVNECARVRATCRKNGVTVPDNDLWIAATANTREWPLVSCDELQRRSRRRPHPASAPEVPADQQMTISDGRQCRVGRRAVAFA